MRHKMNHIVKTLLLVTFTMISNYVVMATDGVPSKVGEPCTFTEGVRYSQLVINSRINDFKANTTASGFGIYDAQGNVLEKPQNSKSNLDYVPGLVAKAILETIDYYKDCDVSTVAPWFYAVQNYGNQYDIASAGKQGQSFDDLNAVKLYFKLATLAASGRFTNGTANATTATTVKKRFADALSGITKANTTYVIKESTLAGAAGGWWHKSSYVDQMWCDGQYMGSALLAQMINEYADYHPITADDWDLIVRQFTISWHYLWNDEVKLLYHAFTAAPGGNAASKWAGVSATKGAEIYHSAEYWGRAEAWYFLALVDVLEQMQVAGMTASASYQTLRDNLQKLAAGIAAKQDVATGCWYQLLNHDGTFVAQTYNSSYRYTSSPVANYLESSCTAIFTAAYLKGMRLGLFDADYTVLAKKAYQGFVNQFMVSDGKGGVHLVKCCKSAGLGGSNYRDGTAEYYLMGKDTEPTTTTGSNFYTEGKVLGGFILAATEYERLTDATSVKAIRMQTADDDVVYSLTGQRLQQEPRRGIYLKAGKAYIKR